MPRVFRPPRPPMPAKPRERRKQYPNNSCVDLLTCKNNLHHVPQVYSSLSLFLGPAAIARPSVVDRGHVVLHQLYVAFAMKGLRVPPNKVEEGGWGERKKCQQQHGRRGLRVYTACTEMGDLCAEQRPRKTVLTLHLSQFSIPLSMQDPNHFDHATHGTHPAVSSHITS